MPRTSPTITRPPAQRSDAPVTGRSPASRPAGRDPFFDNAKLLLVVLVVIGHAWRPLIEDSRTVLAAYYVVYSFHVPAFVLISGFFSPSLDNRPDRVRRLVTGLLVPYLVFEAIYEIVRDLLAGDPVEITPLSPFHLTWFLLVLFIWRITAPVWRVVRAPVPVAFAIALLAGATHLPSTLEVGRVLQFLPWFVLGLTLRPEHLALLRRPAVRWGGLALSACCCAGVYWLAGRGIDYHLFYMTRDYGRFGMGVPEGVLVRSAQFGVTAVLTATFLAWTPRRTTWYTALGAGTLYAYLLHGLVLRLADDLGLYRLDLLGSPPGIALVTLGAAALGVALAASPVRRVFRPLVEPELRRFFREEPPVPARPARPAGGPVGSPTGDPVGAAGIHGGPAGIHGGPVAADTGTGSVAATGTGSGSVGMGTAADGRAPSS